VAGVSREYRRIYRFVPLEVVLVLCKSRATGTLAGTPPLRQTCEVRMDSSSCMCIERKSAAVVSDAYRR
jgi:hypothetical protein